MIPRFVNFANVIRHKDICQNIINSQIINKADYVCDIISNLWVFRNLHG